VLTALLFGTLPALRITRLELTDKLKDGRSSQGGVTRSRLANALVVSQVAFSLVLLVGAGLFIRTLGNLTMVDTGFNKENILVLQTDPSSAGYKEDDPRLTGLYQQIEERVSALPGVTAASFSFFRFHEGSWNSSIIIPGIDPQKSTDVRHNVVGNGYFKTMQIPVIAGRSFGPQDTATSQKVTVISERMAKTYFPDSNPIGHHYRFGSSDGAWDMEVIGVVKDAKFGNLQEDPQILDYLAYPQRTQYLNDFEVRYTGDYATVSAAVQQVIHSVDHNLPIAQVMTLEEQVSRSITQQRTVAQLSGFFGLLAVFLSCIGIYGLTSYTVSKRTNEIGIRIALGAARSNVRWLVMREVILLLVVGVAIGTPAALAGNRIVAGMLFGLHGIDFITLLTSLIALLLVGALAGFLPARRASRVEPMVALRYE